VTLFDPDALATPPDRGPGGAASPGAEDVGAVPGLVRLRLVVAYNGSGFSGFAPQRGRRTVGGALEEAIGVVARTRPRVVCAGRTDAGVHALGQVVHVDLPASIDLGRLVRAVNRMLAPTVVVRRADVAPWCFDARRSALSRRYRYLVLEAEHPDPLLASLAWHVPPPLDLAAMRLGVDPLLGEHDFRALCRRPPPRQDGEPASLVRRVLDASWHAVPAPSGEGRLMCFEIEANAFCHQMVRSIVGLLVEVGRGRRRAGEVSSVLAAGDRSRAGPLAPPHGLCLVAVRYPPDEDLGRSPSSRKPRSASSPATS
jgi:tRNA pseudouridine38-40 synthase